VVLIYPDKLRLGEESTSAEFWKASGDDALRNDIKGVIMMVSIKQRRRLPIVN
jgi:hypothetical protein